MCHVSHVTCHMTTTLCNFSCYESPRMLCDAAEGGLVIDIVKKKVIQKYNCFCKFFFGNLRKNLFDLKSSSQPSETKRIMRERKYISR